MRKLKRAVLYWKLAIAKVSGKALLAGALSVAQTLNGVSWDSFSPSEKFVAIVTALGIMWAIVDAFLDTTMSQLAAGWNPDDDIPPKINPPITPPVGP
jgi:hypothetical protein